MVGLVVVSHTRQLGEAAVDLARQMVQGKPLRIEVAAGLDDESTGTDARRIADAITRADDGDGVVVLMDLGAAILSSGAALQLIDVSLAGRVVLSPGPFVEGLVVAAVRAAGRSSLAEVAAEAADGLMPKQYRLGDRPAGQDD